MCLGLRPSGPISLVSLLICCLIPATRISKNSSRLELKMVRNLTRSIRGGVGSCASSRTRRLNSSQLSSRLIKFSGAEKRSSGGESFRSSSTLGEGSSATLVLATAVGILHRHELATQDWHTRLTPSNVPRHSWLPAPFKQPLLGRVGKTGRGCQRCVTVRQRRIDAGCPQQRPRKLRLRQCWWRDRQHAPDSGQ